jgi:glutathione S-transferase
MPVPSLYWFPGNASMAPHMALEEVREATGAGFELRLVDRKTNAHQGAAYRRVNPNGKIPAYQEGDFVLFESSAICLHIADRNPGAGLIPPLGSDARAHCYKWIIHLATTLQAEDLVWSYPERWSEDEKGAAAVRRKAEARLAEQFDRVEAGLAAGGPYFLGESLSIADFYLPMLVRWTRNMARPARGLPAVKRHLDLMLARPAVQRALETEALAEPVF